MLIVRVQEVTSSYDPEPPTYQGPELYTRDGAGRLGGHCCGIEWGDPQGAPHAPLGWGRYGERQAGATVTWALGGAKRRTPGTPPLPPG